MLQLVSLAVSQPLICSQSRPPPLQYQYQNPVPCSSNSVTSSPEHSRCSSVADTFGGGVSTVLLNASPNQYLFRSRSLRTFPWPSLRFTNYWTFHCKIPTIAKRRTPPPPLTRPYKAMSSPNLNSSLSFSLSKVHSMSQLGVFALWFWQKRLGFLHSWLLDTEPSVRRG